MNQRAAFFLNGEFFSQQLQASFLNSSITLNPETVFWVDGGVHHFKNQFPQAKHVWIGDGDSRHFERQIPTSWQVEKLKADKDLSDYAAALEKLENVLDPSVENLCDVFASFGGRIDHELITLVETHRFVKRAKIPTLILLHPWIVVSNSSFTIQMALQDDFSLFALDEENLQIKIEGALYSGGFTLQRPSHGLSNKALQEEITVHIHRGVCILCLGKIRHV